MFRRTSSIALSGAAVLALAACSVGEGGAGGTTTAGDAANCPGEVVDVVVSVAQWSDLVTTLGGDCASVTTVLASTAVDPHDYEPTSGDIAAFTGAQVVLLNGAGYDSWAAKAVDTLDPKPTVLTAADLVHDAGPNPHLWYSPDAVQQVAAAVTDELAARSRDAAGYFAAQATAWNAELQPYLDEIATLHAAAADHSYAATETVFDPMAAAIGLTDATPEGYRDAMSNESDPSPGDIAAFGAALADGEIDVLVFNTQTEGSVPDQVRAAAEQAGVPVVEVTESPTEQRGSFVAWQLTQLEELSAALGAR